MSSRSEQSEQHTRIISGTRDSFDEILSSVANLMQLADYPDHDLFSVRLALEEALANAVLHGHLNDDMLGIKVKWKVTNECVEIVVIDQGRGYDPSTVPDPTASENLTLTSGRGLAMMRAFMDDVQVNARGNEVTMLRSKRSDDN